MDQPTTNSIRLPEAEAKDVLTELLTHVIHGVQFINGERKVAA